jgi:outer membrane protein OmpA-like peptidoglycan-associated protein
LSIGTGVEFASLRSSLDISNFSDYYVIPAFSGMDKPMNLEISGHNYKQTYTAYYINIPITARYQTDIWKQHMLYVAAGLKIGIPIDGKYAAKGDYTARAFERNSYGENTGDAMTFTEHGFGYQTVNFKDGDFSTKWNWMLTLETGMKWRFKNNLALYTGLFLDYGLNDIRKGARNKHIIDYSETTDGLNYNKINIPTVSAVYASNTNGAVKSFSDKVNTFLVGIKVQFSLGLKPYHKKPEAKVKEPEIIPVNVVNQTKPLTSKEVSDIVAQNTQALIDAHNKKIDEIKALLDKEETNNFKTVYGFDLNSTAISPEMLQILNDNFNILLKNKTIKVILTGHTDELASYEYNMDLGTRRAQAVKNWLVANGIAENRITVSSKGKTQPIVANVDETYRRYNRRVVFEEVK